MNHVDFGTDSVRRNMLAVTGPLLVAQLEIVYMVLIWAAIAAFPVLFRKVIIVVPLTILLPNIAGIGVMGVFIAEPVSNFIGGLSCYITMRFKVMRRLKRGEKLLTETKEAA